MEYKLKTPIIFERAKQLDSLYLPMDTLSPQDRVVFDLSRVSFIKPLGLIGILLLIERITQLVPEQQPQISIIPPTNQYVLDYVVKVDFISALSLFAEWSIPEETRTVPPSRIRPVIPITRFRSAADIEQIANLMQSKFHTEFMGLTTLLQPCHVIFSELADNILHHANSNGGFVLAQQYNYQRGPMLEIAVGDCGVGIASSLQQNPELAGQFANDKEAIVLAFQDGISCLCDSYRGFGLGYVEQVVVPIVNRSLTVRSGKGYAIMRGGGYTFQGECSDLPGTLTHVVLPCDY